MAATKKPTARTTAPPKRTAKKPISFLPVPQPRRLPAEIQELMAKLEERAGHVPNVVRAYAFRPERFLRWWKHYQTVMRADSGVTHAEREMIAVTVSGINKCEYCIVSHAAALRVMTGDEVLADALAINHRRAAITPKQRAMLDYAVRITIASHEIEEKDIAALRKAGWTDEDISDIAETASSFNYSNRMANALGWVPNELYHSLGRGGAK
jgi:uncharacterized peroxidase-related enzyme